MTSACFSLDLTTVAPNGAATLELSNPGTTCSTKPSIAVNAVKVDAGHSYTLSGQIMTEDFFGASTVDGAMYFLYDYAYSPHLHGTTDWSTTTIQHVEVPAGRESAPFELTTYGAIPTGNAWFANLSVQEEIPPGLQMFLLYPNYRGLMFSDQSQVASVDLTVTPPAGTSLGGLQVELDALDAGGNTVANQIFSSASTEFTGTLDLSALPLGTYQLSGKLEDTSGNILMTQSPYAIVKLDASARAGMKAYIDPANLAHFIDGNPHFVLGIYDTTDYSDSPSYYTNELASIAHAPINMMINYYITEAPTQAIDAYVTAMKPFGMVFLPDVEGFYAGSSIWPAGPAKEFGTDDADTLTTDYVSAFTSNPGVVGYYVQDEPAIGVQPQTFHQYGLIKAADPAGFNYAVLNRPLDLPRWRDTVDVLGVDPYPIASASNNDLAEIADWTRAAYQAGDGARPVWTVIQFFQADLESVWPTQQQLHDMSWMAIVEGATGVFYWEYGLRGLYSVKNPAEHTALYQELIDVTSEIKSLEPVLLSPDAPVITANSQQGTVFTKTKIGADGTRYVFAYNYTGAPVSAEFTLAQPAASIIDYDTGIASAPDSSTTFPGAFQPYQAHIFLISDNPPPATPVPSATPSSSATASSTPAPTVTSTATPTLTPTATATATATATVTATATATSTATATPDALSVSPVNLKFSTEKVGDTSSARILKVTNHSGVMARFTAMTVTGDFTQSNACGKSLAGHANCYITMRFKPIATGKLTGNLKLIDNAANSPQAIALSGKGARR